MKLKTAIRETLEHLELNGGYEDGPTEEDALDELIGECGQDSSGYCHLAGSEYCDFECPFRDEL